MDQKFFVCNVCGNLVGMINESGIPIVCCGERMEHIIPNGVDAALEKHVPVVEVNGNEVVVTVGDVIHPMGKDHYIGWVYLKTNLGGQRHQFEIDQEPVTKFMLAENEKPEKVYAYCNLHSIWVKSL